MKERNIPWSLLVDISMTSCDKKYDKEEILKKFKNHGDLVMETYRWYNDFNKRWVFEYYNRRWSMAIGYANFKHMWE